MRVGATRLKTREKTEKKVGLRTTLEHRKLHRNQEREERDEDTMSKEVHDTEALVESRQPVSKRRKEEREAGPPIT